MRGKGVDLHAPIFGIWQVELTDSYAEQEVVTIASLNDEGGLQKLLKKYQIVFAEPQGLPPYRSYNHTIPLVQNAQPINTKRLRLKGW